MIHCSFCGVPMERIGLLGVPRWRAGILVVATVPTCRECYLRDGKDELHRRFREAIENDLKLTPFHESEGYNLEPE